MARSGVVSIVVNNYNYARFLGEAIDSALAQTHPHTQVVVVDDGSTDESRDVIAKYGDRVVAVCKENGGQASAFNAGIEASHGEVVCFLDADDLLLPTAAAVAARRLHEDPAAVRVHWPLLEIDEQGRSTGHRYPRRPLAEGDMRPTVLAHGPISFINAPTSGNAWRRSYLEAVFPVRECGDKHGADAYLFTLSPFYGELHREDVPQGCYRIHTGNFSGHSILRKVRRDVRRYDHHCKLLADHLARSGVDVNPETWKGPATPYAWMKSLLRATDEVEALVPADATLILVDENQWGGKTFLPERRVLPFPEHGGDYWGPPADDDAAIAELERLRAGGADLIVFASGAFWWLDHYARFAGHLNSEYRRIDTSDCVVAFDLRKAGADALPARRTAAAAAAGRA
jgi:glycosyltransferase involved in cell wall biosynthesis